MANSMYGQININVPTRALIYKTVIVNGYDLSNNLVQFTEDLTNGNAAHTAKVIFPQTIGKIYQPMPNDRITIYRGTLSPTDEKVFDGYIQQPQPSGISFQINTADMFSALIQGGQVNYNYNSATDIYAGVVSELARDIICKFCYVYAGPFWITDDTVFCCPMQDAKNVQDLTPGATGPGTAANTMTNLTLVTGTYGGAILFDGTTSTANFGTISNLNNANFTIEAWVKLTSLQIGTIMSNTNAVGGANSGWTFGVDGSGHLTCTAANATTSHTAAGATALATATWYHVAATYDGATIAVYVNGVQDGMVAHLGPLSYSNTVFCIGSQTGVSSFFKGTIDDNRISSTSYAMAYPYTDSIVSTGTALTFSSLMAIDLNALDIINDFLVALNYQCYYKPAEGRVKFEPVGYTALATVIYATPGPQGQAANVAGSTQWIRDLSSLANQIKFTGYTAGSQTTQTFSGDGATTKFTLTAPPTSIMVSIGGVTKTGGGFDTAGNIVSDYATQITSTQLVFKTAPPAGSGNISATYNAVTSMTFTLQDGNSQKSYGVKPGKKMFYDVTTLPNLINRGTNYLAKYAYPFLTTTFLVPPGIIPVVSMGSTINVVDNINNISGNFLITKHSISWPSMYDMVTVGNRPWSMAEVVGDVMGQLRDVQNTLQSNVSSFQANAATVTVSARFRPKSLTLIDWNIGTSAAVEAAAVETAKVEADQTNVPVTFYSVAYF